MAQYESDDPCSRDRGKRGRPVCGAIAHAEPISPVYTRRGMQNTWRHYERWSAELPGFIAIGDFGLLEISRCGHHPGRRSRCRRRTEPARKVLSSRCDVLPRSDRTGRPADSCAGGMGKISTKAHAGGSKPRKDARLSACAGTRLNCHAASVAGERDSIQRL